MAPLNLLTVILVCFTGILVAVRYLWGTAEFSFKWSKNDVETRKARGSLIHSEVEEIVMHRKFTSSMGMIEIRLIFIQGRLVFSKISTMLMISLATALKEV